MASTPSLLDGILAVREICVTQGSGFFRDNVLIELRPSHLETIQTPGPFAAGSSFYTSAPKKNTPPPMKVTPADKYPIANDNPTATPTVAITVIKAKSDVVINDFRFRCTLKGMQYIPFLDMGEEGNLVDKDGVPKTPAEYKQLFAPSTLNPDAPWQMYSKGIVSTKLGFVFVHKEEDEELSSHQINIDGIPAITRTPNRDYPLYTSQGRVICGWYGKLNGWNEPAKDLNLGSMEPFNLKAGDEVVLIYRALVEQKIPQFLNGGATENIGYPKFDMTGSIFYKSSSY